MSAPSTSAQVQALRKLYLPPDPGNDCAPTSGKERGAGEVASNDGLHGDSATNAALRRVRGLLPTIVTETRIALECARDAYLTGGIEVEDGKRLRTAYERLKRAAEVVADAEREVCQ
ncbi:MAG: hypothetical protein R3F10_03465 [Lysobacteraceae bacterium]